MVYILLSHIIVLFHLLDEACSISGGRAVCICDCGKKKSKDA